MSKKPKIIGKNVELNIHTLGQKGDGIATWDEKNAQVYIDGAMVGEKITATITKGHDEILRGKITDISQLLSKAPERVDPKCSIAYKCGGCGLQHMQQQFYKDWKVQRVKDIFERSEIAPRHWHERPGRANGHSPDSRRTGRRRSGSWRTGGRRACADIQILPPCPD